MMSRSLTGSTSAPPVQPHDFAARVSRPAPRGPALIVLCLCRFRHHRRLGLGCETEQSEGIAAHHGPEEDRVTALSDP